MKLKTLNASRSGLIRACSSLRADPVFLSVFPDQKKKGAYYTILNGLIISSHGAYPPYPLGSSFHHPQPLFLSSAFFLWPVSSCVAGDIKIIPKNRLCALRRRKLHRSKSHDW